MSSTWQHAPLPEVSSKTQLHPEGAAPLTPFRASAKLKSRLASLALGPSLLLLQRDISQQVETGHDDRLLFGPTCGPSLCVSRQATHSTPTVFGRWICRIWIDEVHPGAKLGARYIVGGGSRKVTLSPVILPGG